MKLKKRLLLSIYFIALAIFNFLLAWVPFFGMRRLLLAGLGWRIGKKVAIHRKIKITSLLTPCEIGDYSVVNSNCLLDNRRKIFIGHNVSISQHSKIFTLGHDISSSDFATRGHSVSIEDYAVIFSCSILMPKVRIGRGSVVLPGAVVSKDTDPYGIYGGNPIKKISVRPSNLNYQLDYRVWFGI